MAPPVRLVIFDLDGVLIDSEPIANRVLVQLLQRAGISLPESEAMQRFVGRTRDQCIALAAEIGGKPLPEEFAEEWDAALYAALRKEASAVEGVEEALDELTIPYCVASNGMLPRMRLALEAAGLLHFFDGRMFSATQVAHPKPAPDLFLHAAKAMNVAPAASAVVEDTTIGVMAARAAGMRVLGYTGCSHADPAALEREGAQVFSDMRLLPELLQTA